MRWLIASALVLGCGARQAPSHPACSLDDGEIAAIAAVLADQHIQPVIASRFGDCMLETSAGQTRLVSDRRATALFLTSCWARGGPASRGCEALAEDPWSPSIAADIVFTGRESAQDAGPVSAPAWPPGDAPTVYVEYGSYAQSMGYTVQWIEGAWRVVEEHLAWTT